MGVEINRCPTTLPLRAPRVKPDGHWVFGSPSNGVPSPRNSFLDVCGLRFNKPWLTFGITVYVQEFRGIIAIPHDFTKLHELGSGPDPIRA
jgi:hypothetical protein